MSTAVNFTALLTVLQFYLLVIVLVKLLELMKNCAEPYCFLVNYRCFILHFLTFIIIRVAVARHTAKSKNLAMQRKLAKSKWSKEEDSLLKYLAEKENGTKNWREIALHIPGRTAIDCLHRFEKTI